MYYLVFLLYNIELKKVLIIIFQKYFEFKTLVSINQTNLILDAFLIRMQQNFVFNFTFDIIDG